MSQGESWTGLFRMVGASPAGPCRMGTPWNDEEYRMVLYLNNDAGLNP